MNNIPRLGHGARWSDIEATLDRVDAVLEDLDPVHPDSAQVAADLRAAIANFVPPRPASWTDTSSPIQTADRIDAARAALEAAALNGIVTPTLDTVSADASFAVRGAYEDRFLDDEPPPLAYEQLLENIRLLDQMDPPPGPIQLTQQQLDLVPIAAAYTASEPGAPDHLAGVPVQLVDTVEESTPYKLDRERRIAELRATATPYSFSAERARNAEQIQRIFGEPTPARPGWLRRAIRRLFS